ncbi:MAG: tetratricopeptide repeat protein [Candidatus Methanoperedens sp.]
MSEHNKTEEFLKKLAPCIERGDLDACVEEAARVAREMGIGAKEILELSAEKGRARGYDLSYILALAAAQGLEGEEKAMAFNNAGLAAFSLKKLEIAEKQYLEAIKVNPNYAKAHTNYAILLKDLKRFDEAEKQHLKAIKAKPKLAEAHNYYAILLKDLKRFDEAEKQYLEAIKAKPNYATAQYNYALLLEKLKRFDEAEKQYLEAIKSNPNLASAHNNYANLLKDKALFYEAEKEVRIALQIKATNPYALGTLGDILLAEEYYEEAEKEYKKALKNSASMETSAVSEIRNNLGFLYAQLKQYSNARNEFMKAIALEPLNVKAIRNLRKLGKRITPEISKIQICLAVVLLFSLSVSFYLFWITRFSETMFATQSSFLIALLVFIFLYHQLDRFKAGPFEFEKGTEHRLLEAKSQPLEFER